MACGYLTYGQVPSTTVRPRASAASSSVFTAPWVRTTTVVPTWTSAMALTVPTPFSRIRATACGLWMMGPRVTTWPTPWSATCITWSTVRRTPQQNPAVRAIFTSMASSPRRGHITPPRRATTRRHGRAWPLLVPPVAHEAVLLVLEEDVEGGQRAVAPGHVLLQVHLLGVGQLLVGVEL